MCRRFALFDDAQQVADNLGYPIASGATFPPRRYTEVKDRDTLKQHLRPISPSQLVIYAVSMAVNDATADCQNLLAPFEDIEE